MRAVIGLGLSVAFEPREFEANPRNMFALGWLRRAWEEDRRQTVPPHVMSSPELPPTRGAVRWDECADWVRYGIGELVDGGLADHYAGWVWIRHVEAEDWVAAMRTADTLEGWRW